MTYKNFYNHLEKHDVENIFELNQRRQRLLNESVVLEMKYDPETVNKAVDGIQLALDLVGLEPTFGTAADASNAVISLLRAALAKETDDKKKHLLNAAISSVSMIPFGDFAKLIKLRWLRKPTVKLLKFIKKYLKGAKPSYHKTVPNFATL